MEKHKNYLLLVLKGCAMGAADVVPGVSGGTIAFITGIYEELIEHGVDISEVVLAEKKYLPQKRKASLENKIAINHLIEKNVKVTVQEFPNEEATVIEKYKIKGNKGENKIW